MREQAELAIDPVFSEESVSKKNREERDKPTHVKFRKRPFKRGRGTSQVTNVHRESGYQRTETWYLCKKLHNLNECEHFLKKSLSDRRNFVVEKKVYFGCFSGQRIAKHCKGKAEM